MALPTGSELQSLLIAKTFESDAFVVARGDKTALMLELEAEKAEQAAQARHGAGLPPSAAKVVPPPSVAPVAVLEKLAGVLKLFVGGDQDSDGATKIALKNHFSGTTLELHCDATWDAAVPGDVTFAELAKLGMHRHGQVPGIEKLGQWVKGRVFEQLMPNGELADDFVCLVTLLQLDPTLSGGLLEWNEMDCAITLDRKPYEPGLHNSDIRIAIGSNYSVRSGGRGHYRRFVPSDGEVQLAVESLARDRPYHEAREYLLARRGTWDGKPYIGQLPALIGAVQAEKGTARDVSRIRRENELGALQLQKTLLGVVARTFEPGCQMDTMLVLKSKQGTKKSTLFRTLAPANRFSDAHLNFGDKDTMMAMQQNAIYECSELAGMRNKEIQIVKAFISCRSDDFRMPYARKMSQNPRHCVLVGTTNDERPLTDSTGTRRFWVVVLDDSKKVDIKTISAIKDQLWAEAVALYDAAASCPACAAKVGGEPRCPEHRWWLTPEEDQAREQVNEQFTEQDPFDDWLDGWVAETAGAPKQGAHHSGLRCTDAFKIYELLQHMGFRPEHVQNSGQQARMAKALKRKGFASKRSGTNGVTWMWNPNPAGQSCSDERAGQASAPPAQSTSDGEAEKNGAPERHGLVALVGGQA